MGVSGYDERHPINRARVFSWTASALLLGGLIPVALGLSGSFSEDVVIAASVAAGLGLI